MAIDSKRSARSYFLQAVVVGLACVSWGCDFTFDEAGNGSVTFSIGSPTTVPVTGMLRSDPGPGGGLTVLFYSVTTPIVGGDVLVKDTSGAISDLLRFDPLLGGVFVYSSDTGQLADQPLPKTLEANLVTVTENPSGLVVYTPTPGQPGFLPGSVDPMTYHFSSSPDAVSPTSRTLDIPFQTKIFPNLSAGDSVINIGNTGASATLMMATASAAAVVAIGGNICVNVYAFSPDEQEVACCTCFVTPNGVVTTSARQLISKTLTPAVPTAITVKLLATDGSGGAGSCNAAVPGATMPGLIAFGTNIHSTAVGGSNATGTFAVTETPFIPSTLSAAELGRVTTLCGFIQSNGTGFGVCPGCAIGAAGGARQ